MPARYRACARLLWLVLDALIEKYFEEKHVGTSMPTDLKKAVTLAYHERELVSQLLHKMRAKKRFAKGTELRLQEAVSFLSVSVYCLQ